MTETDAMVTSHPHTSPHLTEAAARRRAARQRGGLIFRSLGLAALGLAALFLVALMYSVFKKSYNGFVQSFITLEIPLDAEILDPEDLAQYQASVGIAPELWAAEITPTARGAKSASRKVQRTAAYKKMVEAMIDQNHGEAFTGYDGDRARNKAISQTAGVISTETLLTIRDRLVSGEYRLGETVTVRALAAGDADVLFKDMKRQLKPEIPERLK